VEGYNQDMSRENPLEHSSVDDEVLVRRLEHMQEGGMRDIRSVETKPVEYPAYEVIKPKVDILRLKLAKKLDLEGEEIAI